MARGWPRIRLLSGAGVGESPDGHRWDAPPKVRFARDSPLEEAVTSEPVSGKRPEIPSQEGKNKTAGFAIEFAGKRDPFRWRMHFIPAYDARARAREATGIGATPLRPDGWTYRSNRSNAPQNLF